MTETLFQSQGPLAGVVLQLGIIIVAARICGSAALILRQPRAVGEMVAGLLLGPSLFGHLFPAAFAFAFPDGLLPAVALLSELGLLLLMFQIGCEFETSHLGGPSNVRTVGLICVASICGPLVVGFLMGRFSARALAPGLEAIPYSLYVGVAFAVTAVPILGRILHEHGLATSSVGTISMAAAIGNDIAGWVLLALLAVYVSGDTLSAADVLQVEVAVAMVTVLWLGGRIVARRLARIFPAESRPVTGQLLGAVLVLVLLAAVLAADLGAFAVFGGFAVGLIFQPYRNFVATWRRHVGRVALLFLLPVFFMSAGLRADVGALAGGAQWLWCGAFFATAILSKLLPVYAAARLGGLTGRPAATIAVLMNTRGLMELIVLNIGLDLGFIPPQVYTMLVVMAIGTTLLTGPVLRLMSRGDIARDAGRATP